MCSRLLILLQVMGLSFIACSNPKDQGPVDVDGDGKEDGVGLDLDGDGKVDAIDINGDGVADGNDFDGDGVITIWRNLAGNDALPPTKKMLDDAVTALDPDLIDNVDPLHAPPGSMAGEVPIRSEQIAPPDQVLFAKSQGKQLSCSAWANAALVTLMRARREKVNPNQVWASPSYLYERQVRDTMTNCGGGTYLHHGLNTLVSEGAATLQEVPYRSATNDTLCEMGSKASMGQLYRIGGWSRITPFSRAKIKETLSAGLTIAFAASLPGGFVDWSGAKATGVFKGTGACTDSAHCGGHAMLLVGYDDQRGAYRVLNSWGTDWGDRGYVWWDYDDFDMRMPYGYSVTELPEPTPFSPPNPMTFDVKTIGVVTYSTETQDGTNHWVNVRVQATEPMRVTRSVLTTSQGSFERKIDTWVAYGDVNLSAGGSPPPQEMAKVRIEGVLRDGQAVAKELMVQIPAAAAMGD